MFGEKGDVIRFNIINLKFLLILMVSVFISILDIITSFIQGHSINTMSYLPFGVKWQEDYE
jgi:hypothetical protein